MKFTAAIKSDLIDRHSGYLAKGDTQRHGASRQFFERLELLALLNSSERHSIISSSVNQLWNVHLAFDNFYNEPPFAERLMTLSEQEPIPETIQEQFVHTVIGCYIGNGYGVSNAAIGFYEAMIRSFSPKEIAILTSVNQGSSTVAQRVRYHQSCRRRFGSALSLIDGGSVPPSVTSAFNRLIREFP